MHFPLDHLLYGHRIDLVRDAARRIDRAQWCSAGIVSRDLPVALRDAEQLLWIFHEQGLVDVYYGMLPASHSGEWLPEEAGDSLRLFHLTNDGKRLAKAKLGPPLSRREAEVLVEQAMTRIESVIANPRASHQINEVLLCGSVLDTDAAEFGDVDLVVEGSRSDRTQKHLNAGMENFISQGNERVDVMVYDVRFDERPVDENAATRQLYPRE
jgi:hypothetical protein